MAEKAQIEATLQRAKELAEREHLSWQGGFAREAVAAIESLQRDLDIASQRLEIFERRAENWKKDEGRDDRVEGRLRAALIAVAALDPGVPNAAQLAVDLAVQALEDVAPRFRLRCERQSGLERCPCGEVPDVVGVSDGGGRWAYAVGDCCGEWEIEFRTHSADGAELQELAVLAWNSAPRAAALL